MSDQRTAFELRQQAKKCRTGNGAAILCAIAAWLDGESCVEGELEPHEFVDLWARGESEAAVELIRGYAAPQVIDKFCREWDGRPKVTC